MILKRLLNNILKKHKITGDQVIILESIYQKENTFLEEFLTIEKQRSLLLQNLVRKGYLGIYDEDVDLIPINLHITDKGEDVIVMLQKDFEELKKDVIEFNPTMFDQKFQDFWDTFPSSDKHMHFPRSRILKVEQERCRKLYRKLLEEYSHDDIMKALNFEITMRENNSATGLNKPYSDFKYMKSSSVWLHNKEFLAIQDLMKEDNIEKIDNFTNDI